MKASFVSTSAVSQALRYSLQRTQSTLVSAQKEAQTGKVADTGLALGATTGRVVSFARDLERLNGIVDSNALVSSRLASTQMALGKLSDAAQDLPRHADGEFVRRRCRRARSGQRRLDARTADIAPEHQPQRRAPFRRRQHGRQADKRLHRSRPRRARPHSTPASSPISASPSPIRPPPTSRPRRWTTSSTLPFSRSSSVPAGKPTGRAPPTRRSSAASLSTKRPRRRSAPMRTRSASWRWRQPRSATWPAAI